MNTYIEGIGIPVIAALTYGIVEAVKMSFGNRSEIKKFCPIIAACIGIVLGITAFLYIPQISVADNILTAAFVGLCSGLSSTGMNQLVKKMTTTRNSGEKAPSNNYNASIAEPEKTDDDPLNNFPIYEDEIDPDSCCGCCFDQNCNCNKDNVPENSPEIDDNPDSDYDREPIYYKVNHDNSNNENKNDSGE